MEPSRPPPPPTPPGPGDPGAQNGMAIASIVLGGLGVVIALFLSALIGVLLGVAALVLGYLGLQKAREMADSGRPLAIAGIILGVISIALFIYVLALAA